MVLTVPLLSVNPNVAAAPFVTLGNVAATVLRRMPEPSAQTGPAGTLPLKRSCEPSEQMIGPVNVRLPANVTVLPPVTVRPPSCATPESVWMAPFHVVLPRALIVKPFSPRAVTILALTVPLGLMTPPSASMRAVPVPSQLKLFACRVPPSKIRTIPVLPEPPLKKLKFLSH